MDHSNRRRSGQPTAPRRRPGRRPPRAAARALAFVLGAALLGLPGTAAAQPILGPGDDAFVLPFGQARFGVGSIFENWKEIYGPGGVTEPLGVRWGADSLGPRQIPDVGRAQRSLSTMTSTPSPAVSVGRLVVDASARRTTVPLIGEMGVLPRVMLSVVVPIVRTRTEVSRTLNPGGTDGNLGANPARTGATMTAARTANALLQSQLGAARTRLSQLLTSCPATGGPAECAPINANRAAATALSQRAEAFQASSLTLYGDGTDAQSGLAYVPIVGTGANDAVKQSVESLAQAFQGFGVTQLASTTLPAPSLVRGAEAAIGTIGTDVEAGFGLDSLQGATRVSIGDIEAMATVLIFDGFGSGDARFTRRGVRARLSAGAGLRLGTGEATYSQFDRSYMLPTGTGAGALLLRGAADLAAGSRVWASVVARWTQPFEQTLPLRIPDDRPGEVLLALYREQDVTRTLGRTFELEVTPRWAVNSTFALAGQYLYRDNAADDYQGTFSVPESDAGFGDVVLDAAVLGRESAAREQRAGVGLSYSSVDAYRRGKTRLPVDVTFLHTWTLDATGGLTPRATTDELRVRVWMRLFGR